MPVEALGSREDVTYHYFHPTTEDLSRRVAASKHASIRTFTPSPSGSKISLTPTKKN